MKTEQLWSEYRSKLKTYLIGKLESEADIEDVLQDALARTFAQLKAGNEIDNLNAWLYRVAANAVNDFYRKSGRTQLLDDEVVIEQAGNASEIDSLSQCIEPFLSQLSQEQAELLRAVDLDIRKQSDLAQELGISYSTLKSRVQVARKALRAQFDRCCTFELDDQGNLVNRGKKSQGCAPC